MHGWADTAGWLHAWADTAAYGSGAHFLLLASNIRPKRSLSKHHAAVLPLRVRIVADVKDEEDLVAIEELGRVHLAKYDVPHLQAILIRHRPPALAVCPSCTPLLVWGLVLQQWGLMQPG